MSEKTKPRSMFWWRFYLSFAVCIYPIIWVLFIWQFPIRGTDEPQTAAGAIAAGFGDYSLRDTLQVGDNTYFLYLSNSGPIDKILVTAEQAPFFGLYRVHGFEMGEYSGIGSSGFSLMVLDDELVVTDAGIMHTMHRNTVTMLIMSIVWVFMVWNAWREVRVKEDP